MHFFLYNLCWAKVTFLVIDLTDCLNLSSHDNRRDERKSAEKSPQPPHAEADKVEISQFWELIQVCGFF